MAKPKKSSNSPRSSHTEAELAALEARVLSGLAARRGFTVEEFDARMRARYGAGSYPSRRETA